MQTRKFNQRFVILSSAWLGAIAIAAGVYFFGFQKASQAEETEGAEQAQQGPPPAPVRVAEAVLTELAPLSEAPGSIVSLQDSVVAAATAGKIEWVAEIGAEVEAGDIIARIEKADAEFAYQDSSAEVRRLAARAEYLARLYDRYNGLGDDAGESEASLDEMRSNRDQARQAVAQARVASARAKTNLERTDVAAPFAGRIVAREAEVGEYATNGAEIVRVVGTRELEVTARAPAALMQNISPGDMVTVFNGAASLKATVRAIVPVGDEISRTLEVRLVLPQTDWYIGSAVRVKLPSAAKREVLAVHRDALVLRASRVSVFLIDDENNAKKIDVTLGAAEGDFIEITPVDEAIIKAGDKVVIRGAERLRDGQSVTLADTSSKEEPSA